MNRIKAVIFDWGGVLCTHTVKDLTEYAAEQLNVSTETLFNHLTQERWRPMHDGTIKETDFWKEIANELNTTPPDTESLWKDAILSKYIPNKPVLDILTKLSSSNEYSTGLLSNAEDSVVDIYENAPDIKLRDHFDIAIFSCIVNISKPRPEIYNLALEKMGVKPEESVFIDDLEENIEGARNVGMNGIVYRDYDNLIKELNTLSINI